MRELGVDPAQAVMVGDTAQGIEARALAGVRTVLVTNDQTQLTAVIDQPDLVIDDLSDLLKALQAAS